MQADAPIAAQADDPCSTPNVAPTFLYTNVGVYRPSSAQFLLTTSEAAVVCAPDQTITYGTPGALPLAGKWTVGATADSIGVWHGGVFSFRQSLTDASTTDKAYGNAADTPLVGNWVGDGVDRPAVWRNGQGMFYLDNNDVTQTVLFGNPNDTPIAGDWDGNGVDGVGVWREGMLYLTNTLSGVGEVHQTAFYGLPSDVAVVGVWRELSADQLPPPVVCALPQCPWGGTYLPSTDECQYTFNAQQRKAAAEWAISWAGKACPLFCGHQFAPYTDFSRAILPTPTGTVPSADHRCGWDPINNNSITDCANFVSQAWLEAGMPMNLSWSCQMNTKGICVRVNVSGYPSGWAYADQTFSGGGQPKYIAERISNNTVIGLGGVDTYIILTRMPAATATVFRRQLQTESKPQGYEWTPNAPLPTIISTDIQILMDELATYGFTTGDLMYTDLSNLDHVFIIVGWGPYVETWQQLSNVSTQQIRPYRDLQTAPILYIVDHGPHGRFSQTPSPYSQAIANYKPYYAAWWYGDGDNFPSNLSFVGGNRHFVKVPDIYTLPYGMVLPASAEIYATQQAVKNDMQFVCPAITRVP